MSRKNRNAKGIRGPAKHQKTKTKARRASHKTRIWEAKLALLMKQVVQNTGDTSDT